jgi:hypothetical protein
VASPTQVSQTGKLADHNASDCLFKYCVALWGYLSSVFTAVGGLAWSWRVGVVEAEEGLLKARAAPFSVANHPSELGGRQPGTLILIAACHRLTLVLLLLPRVTPGEATESKLGHY